MSMNVYITARREVVVVKTGEKSVQTEHFDALQTPTKVTYEIVGSANPIQAYKDWVRETGKECEREELVYADDDIFCERDPIGTEMYNPADSHLEDFDHWLESMEKNGYEVQIEVM
jgi:hypothetical protein